MSDDYALARVAILLATGLGVEDIAVTLDVSPAKVRQQVQCLRESGDLARIYGAPDARNLG